jgi:ATP-dependent DNA helicase RecQ
MKHQKALELLQQYWGYSGFRGYQSDIIDNTLDGKHTIGLLPTGGGKSICYQIPGLVHEGWTLVISPLVALMADQHQGLEKRGIKSYHFEGSYSARELDVAFRNMRYGGYKFGFVAPERLANPLFCEYLSHADISLIAVDEAHCISQWGFDFRPAYLNIHKLRDLLPDTTVLALTASATPRVKRDLAEQLRIPDATLFEGSVRRENLHLYLKFTPNKERQLLRLLPKLEGTGIIYAKTRKTCEQLSRLLQESGFSSSYFHAGLSKQEKKTHAEAWLTNKVQVMAATTAFGMGIDKADVGWVIHWDAPDTLEGYYQEVGRGGRGGQISTSYLFFHQGDLQRLSKSVQEVPDPKHVSSFYAAVCSHYQIAVGAGAGERIHFSVVELAEHLHIGLNSLLTNIRLLQHRGFWQFEESHSLFAQFKWASFPREWENLPQQEYERLIALMRLFPAAMDRFVRLPMKELAKTWMLKVKDVEAEFLKWHKRNVLEFQPEQHGSALLLLIDRPTRLAAQLPKKFVDSWIHSKIERTESMISFLQSEECLFEQIEQYFGQSPSGKCGNCSSCKRNFYPDGAYIKERLEEGDTPDDIWFDLNCTPDDLRNATNY